MLKRLLHLLAWITGILFCLVLIVLGIIFVRPTVIINPSNLAWVLEKTHMLDKWSWADAEINHRWIKWNERRISGHFHHLCLLARRKAVSVDTCLEQVSWNFDLTWSRQEGLKASTIEPFKLRSAISQIRLFKTDQEEPAADSPPNIGRYWKMLWSDVVPDMDFTFSKITLSREEKDYVFDLKLIKDPLELKLYALDFKLHATPARVEVLAPPKYPLPGDFKTTRPLYFNDVKLVAQMHEDNIPLSLTGSLEAAEFNMSANIGLPLQHALGSVNFRRNLLLSTTGSLKLKDVKSNLAELAPSPYHVLPAPFNVMNGGIELQLSTAATEVHEVVTIHTHAEINLRGAGQVLHLAVIPQVPLNLDDFSRGQTLLGLDFKEVLLKMPRLSKKGLPPQMRPDPRIKTAYAPMQNQEARKKKENPLVIQLEATGENALHIASNLLAEALRLNLNLLIEDGDLNGHIEMLPLRTSFFRRPIHIPSARIDFNAPLGPEIEATVNFLLPDYKISMKLEGPLSRPRHFFSSKPPLSQRDIFAVLLFGRPMTELDPDDRTQANRSNQILAQGILSLSVLYFFAGSPVEAIGYDPSTNAVSAQVGLGRRSSLRVGTGGEAGIRHSLGKGWYIDTTAGRSGAGDGGEYGVLLERIIAY